MIISHVDLVMLHVYMIILHVNIIMLHVDINTSPVNMFMLHADIMYLECRGQKYAHILRGDKNFIQTKHQAIYSRGSNKEYSKNTLTKLKTRFCPESMSQFQPCFAQIILG